MQLPTTDRGAHKNSLNADAHRWWRWRWVGETHVGLFQKALWGFTQAWMKLPFRHQLFSGLNVTMARFHWHSQLLGGFYAKGVFVRHLRVFLPQPDLRLHMVVRQRSEERWHGEGNPQWERMEDEGRRKVKVSHSSCLRPTVFLFFFLGFFSFGPETMWDGSPSEVAWLTRDVLPFRCFPSKSDTRSHPRRRCF